MKNPKRNLLVLLTACFLSLSCQNKTFKTKETLWQYLKNPENGYLLQKTINGIDYSLLYKPTDVLVAQEYNSNNPKDLQKLKDKYKDQMYFSLSMSKNNHELLSHLARDKQRFGAMVNQLAFEMGSKVHVFTQSKDTLPLTDYVYPRMYGATGSTSMLFVYPKSREYLQDTYLNFSIEDLGFSTGEVRFKFPTQQIKNPPKLIFDSNKPQ